MHEHFVKYIAPPDEVKQEGFDRKRESPELGLFPENQGACDEIGAVSDWIRQRHLVFAQFVVSNRKRRSVKGPKLRRPWGRLLVLEPKQTAASGIMAHLGLPLIRFRALQLVFSCATTALCYCGSVIVIESLAEIDSEFQLGSNK